MIQTVGATVAIDYRTASVFQKYGIDFCCKGGLSIDEACLRKGVAKTDLLKALSIATNGADAMADDFNSWELDKLVNYIQNKHHAYIREQTPVILQFLDKLCKVHGERHPELYEHIHLENNILFPKAIELEKQLISV